MENKNSETEVQINPEELLASFHGNQMKTAPQGIIECRFTELKKFRTWINDVEEMRRMQKIVDEICKLDPKRCSEAQKVLNNGKDIEELFKQAYSWGIKNESPQSLDTLKFEAEKLNATEYEIYKLKKHFNAGKKRMIQIQNTPNCSEHNFPSPNYDPKGENPFFIRNLKVASHWKIFIDETGSIFDQTYFDQGTNIKNRGKFVAILIPPQSKLPKLGLFHATEESPAAVEKVILDFLQKGEGCGLLGVTLDGMPKVDIDYWYSGLERLGDLILRVLKFDKNTTTTLEFLVEERGSATPEMVRLAFDTCLYRFAKSNPQQAKRIAIKADCIGKTTTINADFRAYNGYADSFAYAWRANNNILNEILKTYGLPHHCLLERTSQELHEVIDQLERGESLSPKQWNELLNSPDAKTEDSLIAISLNKLEKLVKNNSKLWMSYVSDTIQHLNSKAIDMRLLSRQLNWLQNYGPAETELPPKLRLLWLTTKLAEENHRGCVDTDPADKEAFIKLSKTLFEEDAPLCCWATLHLAVHYTNAYHFDLAQDVVNKFINMAKDQAGGLSPAVVGLRYYGQILSTRGQHEAFLGNLTSAIDYFRKAIALFERLSDKKEADGEISQTAAYLLTVLMDSKDCSKAEFKIEAEKYFGGTILDAIKRLSISNKKEEKYQHHILLRYLSSSMATNEEKKAYRANQSCWKMGNGHPWEMIAFYRACLLPTADEQRKEFENAWISVKDGNGTLRAISAVILGAIFAKDEPLRERYLKVVHQCQNELPALGERINILLQHAEKKLPPLELAEKVLPFNFR